MSRLVTKLTKWHVRPVKTQISLGIHHVWSESSLSAWRKPGSLAIHLAHSEDSDQSGGMPRLIWVFAGRTVIFCWFCHEAAQMRFSRQKYCLHITCLSTRGLKDYSNIAAGLLLNMKWATSRENLSSEVCDQVRLKPACSATETS